MPLWGNTDTANNKPHFSELREVAPVTSFVTANATTAGNTIVVTAATAAGLSLLTAGMYVYSADANNSISRAAKDLSIIDANEASFWRSNNIVTVIDSANSIFRIQNNVMGTLAAGSIVNIGVKLVQHTNTTAVNAANDTILVTASRMANTQGTTYGGGSTVANTQLGNVNAGWNRITRKINNDGTVRFLKETLVALANPTAANTQSGNTSANAIFGGL
jgi:hypothetical protein